MTEGPGPVATSVFDGIAPLPGPRPALRHSSRHRLCIDQPGETEPVKNLACVLPLGALLPFRLPVGDVGRVGVGIAEQLGGFVEQGNVSGCPGGAGRPVQQVLFMPGHLGGSRGGGEPGWCGEQLGE